MRYTKIRRAFSRAGHQEQEGLQINTPFLDIARSLGYTTTQKGATHFLNCPFHDDPEASLSITNDNEGMWHCHGCGEGGGVLAFLMKLGHDKPSAVKLWKGSYASTPQNSIRQPLKARATAGEIKKSASPCLVSDFATKYGLTPKTIERYGLHVHACGGLAIPLGGGRIKIHKSWQTRGRAMLYPSHMVLHMGQHLSSVVLTEGEMDCLTLLQRRIPAITGTAGANTFLKEWVECFRGQAVVFAYDNDAAGQCGQAKAAGMLKGVAASVKLLQWPPEWEFGDKQMKDVTDFFVKYGGTRELFIELCCEAKEA